MGQVLQLIETQTTAVDLYAKFFPQNTPSCFQQELIEDAVKDLVIWREALIYWAGNDYRPQSVQKLIDYYLQLTGGKQVFGNGRPAVMSKNADCSKCNNERRIRGTLESWPCDACRPQELMAWEKSRNRR
jgi:hypothetical protein